MLGVALAGLTAVVSAEQAEAQSARRSQRTRRVPQFSNAQFYKDGKFNTEVAKDAVLEFCKYHGYPVFPALREQLWVSDYGLGKFTEVGLSAVGFINNLEGEYSFMLQDLFLLPHQMLPEHWHVKAEDTKKNGAQKNEAWIVRWGKSYIIGQGEANLPKEVVVPAVHGDVTVKHCTVAGPGETVKLAALGSHHWQFAGAEGAIMSEVANYHDNGSVRHQNKAANDDFLKSL
jgi:D-lyxose ketol-isomerase